MATASTRLPETMVSPETGETLFRDIRPVRISYGEDSIVVDLPGYYPRYGNDGVHVGDDMRTADEALEILKKRAAERQSGPTRS